MTDKPTSSENVSQSDDQVDKVRDPWTDDSGNEKTVNENTSKVSVEKDTPKGWEKDLVNRLAFASLNEQRRSRRWSIFFKFLFFAYIVVALILIFQNDTSDLVTKGKHTATIEINGPIAETAIANADSVAAGLRDAFADKNTQGIILRINSPGGSPVQAGYIYDEIMRLKEKYPDIPVYSVVSDICASAAYYIAAATDKIYADKASLIGSIGVLMDGYGFVDTLEKLGVERRLMTAGENKAFLDPFSPLKEKHKAHMQTLLDGIHQQFITAVKDGRGNRLKDHPDIFSGLVWSGEKGLELGLIDGLGSTGYVAREIVGESKIVDFTPRPNYLDRLAERIGGAAASALANSLQSPGLK